LPEKIVLQFTKILNFPPKVNPNSYEKTPIKSVFFNCASEEKKDASQEGYAPYSPGFSQTGPDGVRHEESCAH
jgi:hypothetical protein